MDTPIQNLEHLMKSYSNHMKLLSLLTIYIITFVYMFKKNNEITSLIVLSTLEVIFFIYVGSLYIDTFTRSNFNMQNKILWIAMFSAMIMNVSSLITIVTVYYDSYNKYIDPNGDNTKIPIPPRYEKHIYNYKILFVLSVILNIIMVYLLTNMDISNNWIIGYTAIGILTAMNAFAGYEWYIASEFLKLKRRTPIK